MYIFVPGMGICCSNTYWVTQKLPQIYTANHATFPIRIPIITVQNCGNFCVTMYSMLNIIFILNFVMIYKNLDLILRSKISNLECDLIRKCPLYICAHGVLINHLVKSSRGMITLCWAIYIFSRNFSKNNFNGRDNALGNIRVEM